MSFNFPAAPTSGQIYPSPAVAGAALWQWTGQKWALVNPGSGGGTTVYISDIPPAGGDNTLWWESDTGILYVRYNDGDSSQWVSVVGATDPATYSIRYDTAQTLTAAQQVQARQNIYAAPFDAFAYNGMQVNGTMDIDQENGWGTVTHNATTKYALDGWQMLCLSTGMQGSTAPVTDAPPGYRLSIKFTVTAAHTVTTNDQLRFAQYIEGTRVARLGLGTANAQPFTVAFWAKSSVTGQYAVCLYSSGGVRWYVSPFTINAANTWEYKTMTIPGDTTGTWLTDTGVGLVCSIVLAANSALIGTPNAWSGSAICIAAPGQVQLSQTNGATFQFTGFTVLPGSEAPSAAQAYRIIRVYADELLTCQRYWWASNPATPKGLTVGMLFGYGGLAASGITMVDAKFNVTMRANPTIQVWNAGVQNQMRNTSSGALPTIASPDNIYFSPLGGSLIHCASHTAGANWVDFDLIADARF